MTMTHEQKEELQDLHVALSNAAQRFLDAVPPSSDTPDKITLLDTWQFVQMGAALERMARAARELKNFQWSLK